MYRNFSSATGGGGKALVVFCLATVLLSLPWTARAADFSLKLEPGIAFPLTSPQTDIYDPGIRESIKLTVGLTPWLDVGPTAAITLLPAGEGWAGYGAYYGLGAGFRIKRPYDRTSFAGISPWVGADGYYIRTSDLNRPGFDAAVGLSIPVGKLRTFWIGPYVRYSQVYGGFDRVGYDTRDAKTLSVGISFETGNSLERKDGRIIFRDVPRDVPRDVIREVFREAIRDTIYICPEYEHVIIEPDKLELKQKILFKWDSAVLEDASIPLLNAVVTALKNNPGHVQIQGHADSTGRFDYNQVLSEARAQAVLDYLVSHGISRDRLDSKGFSSDVPFVKTEDTPAGHEQDRRVVFVVDFIIVNPGGAK